MFNHEIKVNGKVFTGRITGEKFEVYSVKPEGGGLIPPIRGVAFTKKGIDIAIEELKAIRDRLNHLKGGG